jgi:hypothetical protein
MIALWPVDNDYGKGVQNVSIFAAAAVCASFSHTQRQWLRQRQRQRLGNAQSLSGSARCSASGQTSAGFAPRRPPGRLCLLTHTLAPPPPPPSALQRCASPSPLLVLERFQKVDDTVTRSLKQPIVVRNMDSSIHDVCLELVSRRSAPQEEEGILSHFVFLCYLARFEEEEDGILSDFVFLLYLARFARYFPPLCLRQRLPGLGQLKVPSNLLRRFLRGCFIFTVYGHVTAPAGVFVTARKKRIWMHRVFARVMSGLVVAPLQAAAAARIADKSGVIVAAESGNVADVLSYLIADANCVIERNR